MYILIRINPEALLALRFPFRINERHLDQEVRDKLDAIINVANAAHPTQG